MYVEKAAFCVEDLRERPLLGRTLDGRLDRIDRIDRIILIYVIVFRLLRLRVTAFLPRPDILLFSYKSNHYHHNLHAPYSLPHTLLRHYP